MKHCVAAVAVGLTVGLAGCDDRGSAPSDNTPQDTVIAPENLEAAATPAAPAPAEASAEAPVSAGGEAIAHAPDFIALFPGAEVTSSEGRKPQISFVTDADPDTVIAFYKDRAESAGLRPTAAMNQGAARAYGASRQGTDGETLEVIASPTEEGKTSVQLSWNG